MTEITHFDEIVERIADVEIRHSCRVLYACESGSRAWGFPSTDSDFDVRFVYVRPRGSYLRLDPPRDVIEEIHDPLYDLSGWDLLKALHLFRKTNPPLLEWLDSPIVYRDDGQFAPSLRTILKDHFNVRACAEHYLSMAKNNWKVNIAGREKVRKKKYLYALRPLLCVEWLLERGTMPPTSFSELMAESELDDYRTEIDDLIERKRVEREGDYSERVPLFDTFLETSIARYEGRLAPIQGHSVPIELLNPIVAAYLH